MTYSTSISAGPTQELASRMMTFGSRVLRYGLALVIGWIGMMKFTVYEAKGIQPLVAHSPLLAGCITFGVCGSSPSDSELSNLLSQS